MDANAFLLAQQQADVQASQHQQAAQSLMDLASAASGLTQYQSVLARVPSDLVSAFAQQNRNLLAQQQRVSRKIAMAFDEEVPTSIGPAPNLLHSRLARLRLKLKDFTLSIVEALLTWIEIQEERILDWIDTRRPPPCQ